MFENVISFFHPKTQAQFIRQHWDDGILAKIGISLVAGFALVFTIAIALIATGRDQ
jgi:hypothetical protein